MRTCIILLFSLTLIISCTKKVTDAELIIEELEEFIIDNQIERVIHFELDDSWNNWSFSSDYGLDYKFEGQFIRIDDIYYNLNNLVKYEIKEKDELEYLVLYFY